LKSAKLIAVTSAITTRRTSRARGIFGRRAPADGIAADFVGDRLQHRHLDDYYEAKVLNIEMICAEAPPFARFCEEVERSHLHGSKS
jgi:hypothetical protein